MKTIAIDFDDVVSPQTDAIIAFTKEECGVDISKEAFMHPGEYWGYYHELWERHGLSTEGLFERFLEKGYPLQQVLARGAEVVLKELADSHQLVIVTSRHLEVVDGTKVLVEQLLPGIFVGIEFVRAWDTDDQQFTKGMICQEIGASYLIDDHPEHCNLAAEVGIKALLFGEYGWQHGQKLHKDIDRVADWQEVREYFTHAGEL